MMADDDSLCLTAHCYAVSHRGDDDHSRPFIQKIKQGAVFGDEGKITHKFLPME